MGPEPGGRFGATNVPLRDLVSFAYAIPPLYADYRIAGGPNWIDDDRFDIVAKVEVQLPPDEMRVRVRTLLEDRFAVKAHFETRELPIYALVFAKSDQTMGPRLRRSEVDCDAVRTANRGMPPTPPIQAQAGDKLVCTGRTTSGLIIGGAMLIDNLVTSLGGFAGRIVQNRTGLTGRFDFELTWTAEQSDPNALSLFTAVQEQLGLKLEATRGPVEVLVLDRVERPTPD
jgi:uncharacterized protein (TIGR03435 family)